MSVCNWCVGRFSPTEDINLFFPLVRLRRSHVVYDEYKHRNEPSLTMLTNYTMDGLSYTGLVPSFLGPYQNIRERALVNSPISAGSTFCTIIVWMHVLASFPGPTKLSGLQAMKNWVCPGVTLYYLNTLSVLSQRTVQLLCGYTSSTSIHLLLGVNAN